ncbi:hypothetical protein BDZ90DRAFT_77365 [Jaminaea rosea]|uniref:Uncharacterized protein n=1 Tax=Jaminaea rosea TaxID=1569628 RepID=A0A316UL36_9BASI|nr:hypothetical protein BDZ90DRAFT_77365 [Jaminaea rosea]PWN25091.1 hypothetical protein BDZ90DRAFT_77365 [Jaminaea rosea]
MQENRLKAKARIQAQAAAQYPQHSLNSNSKRPLGPLPLESASGPSAPPRAAANAAATVPSTSRNAGSSETGMASRPKINPRTGRPMQPEPVASTSSNGNAPLPRDQSLGDYIEFDLSRLHNSKGGFLVDEDDPLGTGAPSTKTIQEVRLERERERARIRAAMEPGINLSDEDMICRECGGRELHDDLRRTFGVKVCRKCERKFPEKYSLLTKTEVKEVRSGVIRRDDVASPD